MKAVLSLLLMGFALIAAQDFSARLIVSSHPGMVGALSGNFYYSAGAQAMRIDYDIGVTEIYKFAERLKYLQCGQTCETETWTAPMPSIAVGQGQAVLSDGTVYTMSNFGALDPAVFGQLPNCPQPVCGKRIDFELIFDESGSINDNSFRQETAFAQDFAKSFTWGYDYVGMGLTMFDTNSRLVLPLDFSQAAFIQGASLVNQGRGSTCIGCGIQTALNDINGRGRTIPGTNQPVARVFMVLTDGENNVGNFLVPLNAAKNQGVIFFAVGIGSVNRGQIEEIGSDLPGVQTTFYGNDFSALPGILNGLVTATCSNIPGNPCGAGCLGFCGCGKTCMCPNICDDGNKCTSDVCNAGVNGNGCYFPPVNCDDGNACTADSCDPGTGCVHTPINCDDNNVCTTDTCDPRIGCNNARIVCADLSPCTTDTCTDGPQGVGGCTFTPINNCPQVCNDPTKPITCPYINCTRNECDPTRNGACTATPKVCDDSNPCTIDMCDPKKDACVFTPKNCDDNNKCTTDFCDVNGKCQNVPINVTAVCNDYNACTDDLCTPSQGCIHNKKTCSDGNVCTNDMCSTVTGCYYPPVDCWKQDPDLIAHPDLVGCFQASCNATANRGCVLTPINGSAIDQCGICNGDGSSCLGQLDSGVATGLGAGAVAGIVIGVVGVAAVLGVLGGKKGYDIWLKHRANMQGANTNPLYTHNGLAGNNPMYDADQGA